MANFIGQTNQVAAQTASFVAWFNNTMPAETAQILHTRYLLTRAKTFGLPLPRADQQGQVIRNQQGQVQVFSDWPAVNLSARLAALGPAFGAAMVESDALATYVQGAIRRAVTALGGIGGIDPTGEWSFLLTKNPDGSYAFFPDGTTYTLPGLVFNITQNNASVTVTITVDANTGVGTVAFTVNGSNDPIAPL